MAYLNKYPSADYVRERIGADMDQRISELSTYDQTQTLVSTELFAGTLDIGLMRAWLNFSSEVLAVYPDAEVAATGITRRKTRDELEAAVLLKEQTNRYYHPELYPEYTEDDYAAGSAK